MRNIRPRGFSSSSSSSSRSYSSSPSPLLQPTPRTRTREDVWGGISFHPPPPAPPPNPNPNPNHRSSHFILQDFLAGPFKGKSRTSSSLSAADHHNEEDDEDDDEFHMPRLPPTALSLNSALVYHYNPLPNPTPNVSNGGAATVAPDFAPLSVFSEAEVIGSPPPTVGLFSFCANSERAPESSCSFGGGDGRHKRMMKNRESAARSRARKQAYTNELELEVAHLAAENGKLRKQYEELRLALAAQHSTKKILQRTSTAPF